MTTPGIPTAFLRVAILGGGIVGQAMAQAIAAQSDVIQVCIIDPTPRPPATVLPASVGVARELARLPEFEPDLYFICVGTPQAAGGYCDASQVHHAAAAVAEHMHRVRRPALVAIRSSVPPGTADHIAERMAMLTDVPHHVLSNPEFLRARHALADTLRPDRIVIGGAEAPAVRLAAFYTAHLRIDPARLLTGMSRRTAEAVKYVSNGMLAGRIALINELASWAEAYGADIDILEIAVGADSRIGEIHTSPGYAGTCLPKDVAAILASTPVRLPILSKVQEINAQRLAAHQPD